MADVVAMGTSLLEGTEEIRQLILVRLKAQMHSLAAAVQGTTGEAEQEHLVNHKVVQQQALSFLSGSL